MKLPDWIWLRRILFPRSLRTQLLARSLFILATLLLLIGGVQYFVMKNFLYNSRAETMENQLRSMPVDLLVKREQLKQPPNQSRNYRPILFTPTDTSLGYIQEDGSYVSLTQSTETGYPVLSASEYESILQQWKSREKIKYRIVKDSEGNDQLVVFRPADSPNLPGREGFGSPSPAGSGSEYGERITGLVQMGTETGPLVDVAMRQLVIFLVLSLLAMAGGLLLYMPLIRRTLVPLNQIIQAVAATDAGNLKQRVPEQLGQEEIDRLSSSFNGMLERLELSFEAEREAKEQMRRFTADASHELRTPLTSIHGFLEVLLRSSSIRPEQLNSALNSMHGESIRMKKLIEDLLMLAKLDRAPELTLTRTSLDGLVLEMEPHLRILSGQRMVSFTLAAGISGQVDKDKLKQVVLNLFQNAVQHTDPESGSIHVGLHSTGQEAVLSVSDNGPGIDREHLPHVFERFYRSDVSRARKHGGAGLGLAISLSMIEAHGGTIKVQTRIGEGTTFYVQLPLKASGNPS
ncbi:sensor histidine kinase [Paenibacillus physcomitrellae]|uniref:histidine kinase n=1 Tax=Paenibacillus physcomitrellae TaxID=1619311 RepID=A0ABQ1GKJ7_9BACL|nr:HAMP domain-containing sensor histidine kinase [Paenibacillus physcomitrellae]GGA45454.1 two-component sensor histidine kinase [Paenibacillus physcomitrellae]